MPSRWRIAYYWSDTTEADRRHTRAWEFVADLGEPACFACGWFVRSWRTYPDVSPQQAWNRARGLQRAHLLARARGGPSSVDNLVLLCGPCHAAAPDHRDPAYMLDWMVHRPSWLVTQANELLAELRALGVTPERFSALPWADGSGWDLLRKQYANCIDHFGTYSPATRAAVMKEAIEEYELLAQAQSGPGTDGAPQGR
jgi:hypothetical protein